MDLSWLTEKRKTILLNAAVFGVIAGLASIGKAFLDGQPVGFPVAEVAIGAALTAVVVYLQSKKDDIETGKQVGAKTGLKIGF